MVDITSCLLPICVCLQSICRSCALTTKMTGTGRRKILAELPRLGIKDMARYTYFQLCFNHTSQHEIRGI